MYLLGTSSTNVTDHQTNAQGVMNMTIYVWWKYISKYDENKVAV